MSIRHRHRRPGVSEARPVLGGLPALLLVSIAAGCTMCPDNYDYAGPVPGSSPQTDFRVRSNGLRPIGAAPRPWPRIVRAGSRRPEPTLVVLADDPDDALPEPRVEPVSVLVARVDDTDESDDGRFTEADNPPPVDIRLAEAAAGTSSEAPRDSGNDGATASGSTDADPPLQEVLAELLPPARPVRPVGPPPRETPGWKIRR
jgi:hypothetical protein